jgi:hypothetical protein
MKTSYILAAEILQTCPPIPETQKANPRGIGSRWRNLLLDHLLKLITYHLIIDGHYYCSIIKHVAEEIKYHLLPLSWVQSVSALWTFLFLAQMF